MKDEYQITQAEFKGRVLEALEHIKLDISRVGIIASDNEGKIANFKTELEKQATKEDIKIVNNNLIECLNQMNTRVSSLEIWKANMMGRIAVFVAVFGVGVGLLVDWIKSKLFGE